MSDPPIVSKVPVATVTDDVLTDPPADGDLLIVTVYVALDCMKTAVMVVSDVTVPLEGDHPLNTYPASAVAVTVLVPTVNVFPDDVNAVPVSTPVTRAGTTVPPSVGFFAIVTVYSDPCVKYAVIVMSDVTVPLEGDHLLNEYPDAGVAVMSMPAKVSTFPDDVNVTPSVTLASTELVVPPSVGDLAIVTVYLLMKFAVMVISDVT